MKCIIGFSLLFNIGPQMAHMLTENQSKRRKKDNNLKRKRVNNTHKKVKTKREIWQMEVYS